MEQMKGYFFALLSAVLLGLMAVLVKIVLDLGLSPVNAIFFRFSFASVLLSVFLLVRRISFRVSRRQFLLLLGVAVVGYGLMNLCYYGAFTLISVGLTSMIHYIYPVIVVILARLLYHDTFTRKVYAALVIAVAGAMILSFSNIGEINLFGVLLAFLAGVCYGIYAAFMDHPSIKELHGVVVVFYLSLFTAIFSLVIALPFGNLPWMGATPKMIGIMVAVALFCTVFALFLFREAVVRIGTTHTTILSTMEPVSAAVLGAVMLGEKIGVGMFIGSTLILTAVVLITFRQKETSLQGAQRETVSSRFRRE